VPFVSPLCGVLSSRAVTQKRNVMPPSGDTFKQLTDNCDVNGTDEAEPS